MLRLKVWRFRCPGCRTTATALPDDVLPGLAYDLATLAELLCAYLNDCTATYRQVTVRVLGLDKPVATAAWVEAVTRSPAPTTCFCLMARFAAGARAWWNMAAVSLLAQGDYRPAPAPGYLAAKARSQAKHRALHDAWQAIDAFRQLAVGLGAARARWAFVMRHTPLPPPGRDRTQWFVGLSRPP